MSERAFPIQRTRVIYRLVPDTLMGTYTIERIETIGVFESREGAVKHMLDTEDERNARDELPA